MPKGGKIQEDTYVYVATEGSGGWGTAVVLVKGTRQIEEKQTTKKTVSFTILSLASILKLQPF